MKNSIVDQLMILLETRLDLLGISKADVNVEQSLFEQGILDSLSFLEYMVEVEEALEVDLDLSELDPTEFNSIVKLCNLIENEN